MSVLFGLEPPQYNIITPVYQGPLNLLLSLIERAELDITKLALAQVTQQYLEYLRHIEEKNAEEISSFLVIAAKLIQIKSDVLLPRLSTLSKDEPDIGDDLVQQLKTFKIFRNLAQHLEDRHQSGLRTYLRLVVPQGYETKVDLSNISLEDIAQKAASIFLNTKIPNQSLNTIISQPRITVRQRIQLITSLLLNYGRITFHSIISNERSKTNIIVTFLALLELIKRQIIRVHQPHLFSDIEIEAVETWNGQHPIDIDIEFDE